MSSFLRILSGLKNIGVSGKVPATGEAVIQSHARSPQLFGAQAAVLPNRPKKPLTPYFRFLGQVREQVKKENPSLKQTQLIRLIAQRWDELDESNKSHYVKAYKSELEEYGTVIAKYNASLTEEQKESIQQAKIDKQDKREKRERVRRIKELGRPKKPPSGFLQFLQSKITPGAKSNEFLSAATHWGAQWKNMSDAEKAPYIKKYQMELEQYNKILIKWEDKMIKQGNEDLVRLRPTSSIKNSPKAK